MSDNLSKTKRTSQAMDNFSFDESYLQNTQLILTEENSALIRQPKIATESTLQSIGKFNIPAFDEIQATYPDTVTEVYTYKNASVTVGVLTVIYSDATKAVLTSVTKS